MSKHTPRRTPFTLPLCPTCRLPKTRATITSQDFVAVVGTGRSHEVLIVTPSRRRAMEEVYDYVVRSWPATADERSAGRSPIPAKPPESHEEAIGLYFSWSPDRATYSISAHSRVLLKDGRVPPEDLEHDGPPAGDRVPSKP